MTESKLQKIYGKLCLCGVFHGVLEKPIFRAFEEYARLLDKQNYEKRKGYAKLVSLIYDKGGSLTGLVTKTVFEDENVCVKTVARGIQPDEMVWESTKRELKVFSAFAELTRRDFALDMGVSEWELPDFHSEKQDFLDSTNGR